MAEGTISMIPQEKEANIEGHSIALVPQEMKSKGGDIISNSIPVIQQEFEPNGDEIGINCILGVQKEIESDSDDFRRAFIPMIPPEVGSISDESDDVSTKSISVVQQEVGSNVDEFNDVSTKSIPVISQKMELKGGDIGRNSFLETSQELELGGDDIRRSFIGEIDPVDIQTNSIPVILQEMEFNGGDLRRNYIAGIPQEMEQEGGDIRRNSIIVVGIEATGSAVRSRSIARSIQSRYLRASMGSCHDFCKYGLKKGCEDENLEASPRADRKRTSRVNSKPSPGSIVTEKRVISVTKKGTTFPKKVSLLEVSSPFKEVNVPMEAQSEPSSKVKSPVGHEPSLESEGQILNKSFVTEETIASVTEKRTDSLEKEIDVTMEDSMDLEEEPEQLEPSSFPGSVRSLRNSKVISTEDSIDSKMKPEQSKPSSLTGSMQSMRNSKVVSRTRSKPSKDSETRKLNSSAVMEKKVTTVKKKGTSSSNNRSIGTRKSKEAPDSSSNRSIRKHNGRASLPGEKQTMGMQTVSLSSKPFNMRDSNMNTGSSYNLQGLSHVEDQNGPERVEPQPPSDKDMPEKILYVIESSTENSTMESTPNDASVPKPSPSSAVSVQGKSKSLKHARKGIGRTGSSTSYEKKNLKRVNGAESHPAGPLDQDNKGLRRTRSGTQASLSPSSSSSSLSISSSRSTQHKENGADSQHDRSKTVKPIGQSKVQHKATPRKSPIVGSGNRSSVPQKLAFRRGRVVELQPENSTPRRLKFRRVRLAVEVQNSKGSITSGSIERKEVDDSQSTTSSGIIKRGSNVRKEAGNRQINGDGIKRESIVENEVGDFQPSSVFFKRESIVENEVGDLQPSSVFFKSGIIGSREVDDDQTNGSQVKSEKVVLRHQGQVKVSPWKSLRSKGVSGGLLNGTRSNQEKVVLRHQDVDGKKDDQKSFNNVIEETASKLAETRKSKVKALVGAFETVISLQDRRAAAEADAC